MRNTGQNGGSPRGELQYENPSLPSFDSDPMNRAPGRANSINTGLRLKIRPQPWQVLNLLLSRAGDVVSREELHRQLWPSETFVDFEHGLNNSVKELRAVLGDSVSEPRYIETLPRVRLSLRRTR